MVNWRNKSSKLKIYIFSTKAKANMYVVQYIFLLYQQHKSIYRQRDFKSRFYVKSHGR